ncbi:family 1 glycosylhydrolase [Enterovirga sp.]|uniref:family 1 glycosylhydrolase n=1 Tax=Enterovirga sp. TaxID=2026350 RepID=UPI002621F908|nr:family 1 glycosylhydrolase [Enterovirga sp.]
MRPLEIWGGLECTVVRIGDRFRDQLVETGHRERPGDLDLVAALGIRTLRYPIVWETVAPERPDRCDFAWHDGRLRRMRELGIAPIAGLVHHGSGPRHTNLLDPDFPVHLARYAECVARQYPWITRWTPVNEPLTTARFSCLYGHWYPHRRSEQDCLRALVIQCRATLLAMRAIRRIVPDAQLVQTEDLGRVFSTPALAYQAEHDNSRRWLTFDLLCGRVDREHPWRGGLEQAGVPAAALDELADGEARPAILGINHYLTSDRFLDERTERYPAHFAGGNAVQAYADVEAVRVPGLAGALGFAARLRETWDRYRAPMAVTEVHHGCTRDEQLRWLADSHRQAEEVRREGADLRALTPWSLFGTVDWNSLLTRQVGIYEPGAFDIRGPTPRPTALAAAVRDLAAAGRFEHPVLDVPGWWRRAERGYDPAVPLDTDPPGGPGGRPRTLLVCGGHGPTRRALLRIAAVRGLAVTDTVDGTRGLRQQGIWAAMVLPSGNDLTDAEPRLAPPVAALAAEGLPAAVILSGPGPSRLGSLDGMRALRPNLLEIRTGEVFGPWEPSGLGDLLAALAQGERPQGERRLLALTYLPDLAHVALDLLIDGGRGPHVLANGRLRQSELVEMLRERTGLGAPKAARLRAAGSRRTDDPSRLMPPLASALDRFLGECRFDWRQRPHAYGVAAE